MDLGGGHVFSGEVDVGCVGPMFVAMIVFCWFLDLFFSTIEEKVRSRLSRVSSGPARLRWCLTSRRCAGGIQPS